MLNAKEQSNNIEKSVFLMNAHVLSIYINTDEDNNRNVYPPVLQCSMSLERDSLNFDNATTLSQTNPPPLPNFLSNILKTF